MCLILMRCLFEYNQPIGSCYFTVNLHSATLFVFFLPMSFGLHFALRSPIQKASIHFLIIVFLLLHKVERKNSPPVDFAGLDMGLL